MESDEIGYRKTIEKINKIYKALADLSKKKEIKTQLLKSRMKEGTLLLILQKSKES